MPAKRQYDGKDFLEVLSIKPLSTGEIVRKIRIMRKIRCNHSTALRYLRELKAAKFVEENRISNTSNMWRLIRKVE
jgi:DNA-binding IclR family transcriptional regulator